MSELAELKNQRASTKGCITRIKNIIDTKGSTLSGTELECRLGILESYFKQILSFQSSIEKLVGEDENESKLRGELEHLYCATKSRLLTLMGGHRASTSFGDQSMLVPSLVKSNLPKLKLPQFSGRYSEFPNFIGSFSKLVDQDNSLSAIEKFNHLVSCLSGAALRTVKAFEISQENYPKAVAQLTARYDNKYLTFQEHIVELFNLAQVSKNSASQLRCLIDNTNAHLSALRSLGSESDITNVLIIYIVNSKLDPESQAKWEESMEHSQLPTWQDCSKVLNKRCQFLEAKEGKAEQIRSPISSNSNSPRQRKLHSNPTSLAISQSCCLFCQEPDHFIYKCPKFLKLPVSSRFEYVKKKALCINCLSKGHNVRKCSSRKCGVCSMPHHTSLHRYTTPSVPTGNAVNGSADKDLASGAENSNSTSSLVNKDIAKGHVFLAAALVQVKDNSGRYHLARALLDSASQLNFISENLVQTLKLKRHRADLSISGIANVVSEARWSTQAAVKSRICNFESNLTFYILPHITGLQPERSVSVKDWRIPPNVQLADPQFFKPQRIDLLVGADLFFELLCVGQIKLDPKLPTLQKTVFGWIVSGRYSDSSATPSTLSCVAQEQGSDEVMGAQDLPLNELVERFWKEEGIDGAPALSEQHQACETIFRESVKRLSDGRFMVKLPFSDSTFQFTNSLEIARRRFCYLERKLLKDSELRSSYSKFLEEYLTAGHMQEVALEEIPDPHYFMPHRGVVRPDSSTSKLRVVFDASCRTASNISLNDVLLVGPTIQDDLFSILSRFRCYRMALTADISAMYRQILVYPEDRNFQLILWRKDPTEKLRVYRLNTVTYGTAPAPFLATRCLSQLAEDYQSRFPLASRIVAKDFYMDDLLTGADTREELIGIRRDVDTILRSGQFYLRKWCSNDLEFLADIPETDQERTLRINDTDVVKALGKIWDPSADEFHFQYKSPVVDSSKITKRTILSDTARLFDPLGLINPVVVRAKIFLQELWLLKLSWDESVPQQLAYRWCQFKDQLHGLSNIRVPRLVLCVGRFRGLRFMDSLTHLLELTVAVCIYRLPMSKILTVFGARCGLTSFQTKVRDNFPKPIIEQYLWTDSEIVLDWLASHASNWKTYVSNRVSEIQTLTKQATWRHANSKSNPADIVSRGIGSEDLLKSIWFEGPDFLKISKDKWPPIKQRHLTLDDLPERRKIKSILVCTISDSFSQIVYDTSDFMRNCRRFAYVLRLHRKSKYNQELVKTKELSALEVDNAFMHLVWSIQQREFAPEIQALEQGKEVCGKSCLRKLAPFLEAIPGLKLLRVGGRLKLANGPLDYRFPILLPRKNYFVESYVRHLHRKNFHAGPQALVAIIQQKFWIINARDYARKIVRGCIHCNRYRPQLAQQIMGNLPRARVNSSLPFTHTGVDFAGPIQTTHRLRGKRTYKSYIAVFVCFATRAVHIEVVSDLTSEAFIAALKRFVGRRNLCQHLYCDNATNFVGARRLLEEFRKAFFRETTQKDIASWCSNNAVQFHHIPPRAPHFGGLWEAAVKAAKTHLYRTLQEALLTFEELTTVMVQIEGILNSRPITPLSSDPNDFQAWTPAHFLTQAPLEPLIEPYYNSNNIKYLRRWQCVSALHQHFWERWSNTYSKGAGGNLRRSTFNQGLWY